MLKFVILSMALACALGASIPDGMRPQLDGRIVGGSATPITSYPWQVSVQRSGSHSCGGSIYSSFVIITAAHCLQDVSTYDLTVRVGSDYWNAGGTVYYVNAFKIHEGYNTNTMENDIAIIRLSSSLLYGTKIMSIGIAYIAPSNNAAAVVTGWGTAAYGSNSLLSQLQYVNVNIVSRTVCQSSTYGYGNEIKTSMICAASSGKDACQGDSGGPLVSGGVLVGVVSWGYGCAFANYPGVYANVAELNGWIVNAAYYI